MPSRSTPPRPANRAALLLIPLAALLAILPLLVHGGSCGQDLSFHIQSWLDAARQLRHGHYPRWAFSPAWNAGEPRFLFYPPLSWLLGAALLGLARILHLSANAAPILYIWIALTAAGFAMYRLASHFTSAIEPSVAASDGVNRKASPNARTISSAALLAAVLYLANPYMLFNAFERSALAELLAAAWIPLLLLAVLRPRPTVRGVAVPVALLWLTNAPAAVMGCYTLAFLAALRVAAALVPQHRAPASIATQPRSHATNTLSSRPEPNSFIVGRSGETRSSALCLATIYTAGAALGLALSAFYLIPAAFERRFVQVAMAIIPNMRFQDNFLFTRTADAPHNIVNHTISVLAVVLVLLTAAVLSALLLAPDRQTSELSDPHPSVISTEGRRPKWRAGSPASVLGSLGCRDPQLDLPLGATLAILTLLLTFLLVPLSTPIWQHLPELAFLQFPWRLLTILAPILALALALLFARLTRANPPGAPFMARPHRDMGGVAIALIALLYSLALGFLCFHLYGQACASGDRPATLAALFHTHHGAEPTDEYTPTDADTDFLRSDDPGFWLAADPQAYALHTIPNPNATDPNYSASTPIDQTVSARAPLHLTLDLPRPEDLVLNLRDYPDWRLTETLPGRPPAEPAHISRDDGLLAIALPAGPSAVTIRWRRTPDQTLGDVLSLCALLALALTFRRPAPKP